MNKLNKSQFKPTAEKIGFFIRTLAVLIAPLVQTTVFSAPSQELAKISANELNQQTNAAMCAQCHGTNGVSEPGSSIAGIAGMPSPRFIQRMNDYALSPPNASVMARLARGLTQEQIEGLAIYFEKQPSHSVLKNQL